MRVGASLLALLCVSGCTVEWVAQPTDPRVLRGVDEPPPDVHAHDALGELERSLRSRLRSVEQELEGLADLDAPRGSELRDERLLLTVALREVAWWIETGADLWGGTPPSLDVDSWLEIARRRVAEGRRRVADRRQQTRDGYFDWGGVGAAAADDHGIRGPGGPFGGDTDSKPDDRWAPVDSPPPPAQPSPEPEPAAEEVAAEEDEDEDGDGRGWGGKGEAPKAGPEAAAVVAEPERPVDLLPAVQRRSGELLACFPPAARGRDVRFEVVARLAGDGSLRILRVTADRPLAPATSSCVADVLSAVRVEAAASGASRVVTFPFTLAKD